MHCRPRSKPLIVRESVMTPPDTDSPGYIRVVARGCGGTTTWEGEGDCSHGYTWTCEDCPVLREQWRDEQ